LLTFDTTGEVATTGLLSVVEGSGVSALPFAVVRVYWIYDVPEGAVRGQHAHHRTAQVLVAMTGTLTVDTELPDGTRASFELTTPTQGLYVPAHAWRTVRYSPKATQLVLASAPYDETDYIRDYAVFRALDPR
jgi:5-deoxy-D-glucuronate isomerase